MRRQHRPPRPLRYAESVDRAAFVCYLPNPLCLGFNSTRSAAGVPEIDANCANWLPIMVRTQRSRPVHRTGAA
ncbi:hypothetical protein CRM91_15165 [Burkholderia ambifaria]|nr:hypothetical protein CRM91_15165 [Burkholderia ambifaria]